MIAQRKKFACVGTFVGMIVIWGYWVANKRLLFILNEITKEHNLNYLKSFVPSALENKERYTVCPSAVRLFSNVTELKIVIEKQTRFHQRGGNLASVEEYLDGHMQNTLDRLDIQFLPNGNQNTRTKNSISYLRDYYSKNKVKRGGYGQPLPGKLVGENAKKGLFENRWIDVLEPSTSERYKVSVGPVGPICSNLKNTMLLLVVGSSSSSALAPSIPNAPSRNHNEVYCCVLSCELFSASARLFP